MKCPRWIALVVLAASVPVVLAVILRTETPAPGSGAASFAKEDRAAAEAAVRTALEDPSELEARVERPFEPETSAPESSRSAPSAAGIDSSLGATVEWLKQTRPERFGTLTVEQALAMEVLDLRGAPLTDADLWRLSAFPNLKSLGLRGTAITDGGLAALRQLPLTALDLRGTGVTGRGLGALPVNTLTALHLTDTKVTEVELARMPNMPALATLKLNQLGVGDDAIEALSVYRELRHIELDGTAITDAGLKRLFELHPNLARIEARSTALTPAALAAARAAHPGCEIVVD